MGPTVLQTVTGCCAGRLRSSRVHNWISWRDAGHKVCDSNWSARARRIGFVEHLRISLAIWYHGRGSFPSQRRYARKPASSRGAESEIKVHGNRFTCTPKCHCPLPRPHRLRHYALQVTLKERFADQRKTMVFTFAPRQQDYPKSVTKSRCTFCQLDST